MTPSPSGSATQRRFTIEDQISMREPSKPVLSPDGRWVVYTLKTPDLEKNCYTHDLYVVPTDGSASPRQLTHFPAKEGYGSSRSALTPTWAHDSRRLYYFDVGQTQEQDERKQTEVRTLDIHTGEEATVFDATDLGDNLTIAAWNTLTVSPDGTKLAFLVNDEIPGPAATSDEQTALPARGIEMVGMDWKLEPPPKTATRLWVLDLETKQNAGVTDDSMNVRSFDWSPDGTRFALEANRRFTFASYIAGDIYVMDADGKNLQALVQEDGWDRDPRWSPDGKLIAYGSQEGREDWNYGCTLAVVPADGSEPPRIIGRALREITGAACAVEHWLPDGSAIDVRSFYRMSRHFFRVRLDDPDPVRISERDDRTYLDRTWSRDGSLMCFIEEGVGVPAEICVSPTDRFEPRPLTNHNPEWHNISRPTAEHVSWPSRDGQFTVAGLLIKPSDHQDGKAYPMIVCNMGGPSMVLQSTHPYSPYSVLTWAEMGYVVLMPNSRGREGYGLEFANAIRDQRSYVLNPVQDILAGVDAMIDRGIADEAALAICGFSYGEVMTTYSLVKDNRFKAAVAGGGISDMLVHLFRPDVSTAGWGLLRDMWGTPDIYEPETLRRSYEQTTIFHLDHITTPLLIESGEHDGYKEHQVLQRGLLYFGVPVEHVFYPRSGHGYDEPLILQDSYRRQIAWFEYWIRNQPYPDARKQAAYDTWKAQH